RTFILLAFLSLMVNAQNSNDITVNEIKEHITYLASDELEGRMTGTDALYKAADYLKKEFENYGLKPLFDGSYFQEFPFTEKLEVSDNNRAEMHTDLGNSIETYEL